MNSGKSISSNSTVKKIVLLELLSEFEEFGRFLREQKLNLSDFEIVALSHKLQAYLSKNNISYGNSLKYFNSKAQEKILGKLEQLFKQIETTFDFVDDYGVTHAYRRDVQHYLEVIFNYFGKILSILENAHLAHPDLELYVCADTLITDSVFVKDDRLLGLIAERFALAKKIKLVEWKSSNPPLAKQALSAGRRSFLYTAFFKAFKLYSTVLKRKIIVLPTKHYGFQPLVNEIRHRNPRVTFLTLYDDPREGWRKYLGIVSGFVTSRFRVNLSLIGPDSSNERDFSTQIKAIFSGRQDVFELYGVDFSQIMRAKATKSLSGHLRSMSGWSVKLSALFKDLNIKLIISPFGRDIWALAPELAKRYGVPSLFVSHGTHPVPTDKLHDISIFNLCLGFMLGEYTHVALSTPVQEAHLHYYKQRYPWISNHEIKTGPLIFARPKSLDALQIRKTLGLDQSDFVLLHAGSIKWKGFERFHFLETVDEYLSALSDIIDAVNRHENYKLIIRLHPGFDLTESDLKMFLPESTRFIVSNSGSFTEALSAADLLISYSSTCIDEALINKIPVLLYDKWDRYNHFKTGVFSDAGSADIFPVCYVNNKSNLSPALEFMDRQIQLGETEKMNIERYKYSQDYMENFYKFVEEQINREVTDENSWADSGKLVAG